MSEMIVCSSTVKGGYVSQDVQTKGGGGRGGSSQVRVTGEVWGGKHLRKTGEGGRIENITPVGGTTEDTGGVYQSGRVKGNNEIYLKQFGESL